MGKILVTPRSLTMNGHPILDKLRVAGHSVILTTPGVYPSENELLEKLPDCVAYLAGVEPISEKILNAAKNLKVISRNGTGIDNIDLEAAKRNNIRICRALGANARGVAELTFGHILSLVRAISFSDNALKNKNWVRREGIELQNRILGIIGCGVIGKLVAKFAIAFDMQVIAYDPFPDKEFEKKDGFSYVSMDELAKTADIISLHCSASSNGKPLIHKEMISRMRHGVYLVNTARASLFDEKAITEAIKSGKIAGVAIDTFNSEPPEDWDFINNNSITATPHIGGYTKESVDRAVLIAVENILEVL